METLSFESERRTSPRPVFGNAGWAALAVILFISGVVAGVGCGSKSGGGMTHPAALVFAKNGKTLTTVTGP